MDPRQARLRVGGNDQVDITAHKRRQGMETKAQRQIHLHAGPITPVDIHGRQQPLEAAMTLHGDVQPAGVALRERMQTGLDGLDIGQHPARERQQLLPGGGQAHGPGPAEEQRYPELVFDALDLVRQRALGEMHPIRGTRETPGLLDSPQRAQMA